MKKAGQKEPASPAGRQTRQPKRHENSGRKRLPSDVIRSFVDWFYAHIPPLRKVFPQQTFRYAACGGLNMCLDLLLYFIMYNFVLDKEVVHLGFVAISPYIAAFLVVFPITFLTGFYLNRNVAFANSTVRGHIQLFRYLISVCGSIFLNYILLKFFVEILHFYPTPSKAATTLLVAAYSYLMQKHFCFRS